MKNFKIRKKTVVVGEGVELPNGMAVVYWYQRKQTEIVSHVQDLLLAKGEILDWIS